MLTCEAMLREAVLAIASDSPRLDAELLMGHVTGWSRTSLRAWPEREVPEQQATRFRQLVSERADGQPVAYLLGQQEFWSLPLRVSRATLIPRADTESLVEAILQLPLPEDARVVDLGTGTGAIALALASEQPGWQVMACDAVAEAVTLAGENASALGLPIEVLQSNWFSALPSGRFDLVVSNPPYIAASDQHLTEGDVRYEPATALIAGDDGLADIRHIINEARDWLGPDGWLVLEHGYNQGSDVRALLLAAGFVSIESRRDYGGQERLTLARRPESGKD